MPYLVDGSVCLRIFESVKHGDRTLMSVHDQISVQIRA